MRRYIRYPGYFVRVRSVVRETFSEGRSYLAEGRQFVAFSRWATETVGESVSVVEDFFVIFSVVGAGRFLWRSSTPPLQRTVRGFHIFVPQRIRVRGPFFVGPLNYFFRRFSLSLIIFGRIVVDKRGVYGIALDFFVEGRCFRVFWLAG